MVTVDKIAGDRKSQEILMSTEKCMRRFLMKLKSYCDIYYKYRSLWRMKEMDEEMDK